MANETKKNSGKRGAELHQSAIQTVIAKALLPPATPAKPPKCKVTPGCLRLPGHPDVCVPGYERCPACKGVAHRSVFGPDQWECSKKCGQSVFTSTRHTCITCGALNGHHPGCEEEEPFVEGLDKVRAGWKGFDPGAIGAKPPIIWTVAMGEACWSLALAALSKEALQFGYGWVRTTEKVWHITPKLQLHLGVDKDLLDQDVRPRLRMLLDRSFRGGTPSMAVYDPTADRGNNKPPTLHEMLRRTQRKLLPTEILRIVRRVEAATKWVERAKRARDRHENTLDVQAANAMQGKKQQHALDALTPALVMSGLEKSGTGGVR